MKGLKTFLKNISSALIVQDASWTFVRPHLQRIIPELTHDYHKGQMGRVGVIGGSLDYTGAPFYASKASLLFGGDLVFVFCDKEALLPIKSYSPEFMVTALYDSALIAQQKLEDESRKNSRIVESEDCGDIGARSATAMTEKLRESLWRLHVVVMGPGLGRSRCLVPGLLSVVELIVSENKALVLDADALWLVCHNLDVIRGCERCVLTPNIREFEVLLHRSREDVGAALTLLDGSGDTCTDDHSDSQRNFLTRSFTAQELKTLAEQLYATEDMGGKYAQLRALSASLGGVTVLLKGKDDVVSAGGAVFEVRGEAGSPRRCGGQGDVLAGSVAVALHWALRADSTVDSFSPTNHDVEPSAPVSASMLAAITTKRAAALAFAKKGRSTLTPDLLEELGAALLSLETDVAT